MNTQRNIQISIIAILSMICFQGISQENKLAFHCVDSCQSNVQFWNDSEGYKYFLWIFNGTIQSPAKNPLIHFESNNNSVMTISVELYGWDDAGSQAFIDSNFKIFPQPVGDIESEDWLICSNAVGKRYRIEDCNSQYNYSWVLNPPDDERDIYNENSCEIEVNWEYTGDFTKEILLSATITSDKGCKSTISKSALLLGSDVTVPDVTDVSLIKKPSNNSSQNNIMLCLIDNPELYQYKWFWQKNDGTPSEFVITNEPYFYYDVSILPDYNYWVEISDKDFTLCSSMVSYDAQDFFKGDPNSIERDTKLFLFPNPATTFINMYLKQDDYQTIAFRIRDIYGTLITTVPVNVYPGFGPYMINLPSLPTGVYLAEIVLSNGNGLKSKFIIQ